MEISTNMYSSEKSFVIRGASYIGNPKSNTAMFISKKVEKLLSSLESVTDCLIFAETNIDVPETLIKKHCFVFSNNPQGEYAEFSKYFYKEEMKINGSISYSQINGSFVSDTAKIGDGSIIEPGSVIGPDVVIGNNATILSGAIIKNSIIGNNVLINEKAVIGSNGFTMAEDADGNKVRIFSLGKVIIGNNVEIGAHDNISRGSGGDTIIEDNVKIDALVHVGHDAHLHKNVEITAGAVVGGFVDANEHAYVGINAVLRNRINLGENSFIGMGATVTKSVEAGVTVVGNPARPFEKKQGDKYAI